MPHILFKCRFPAELHYWLREHAWENRQSMTAVIRTAVEQYRERQETER